MQVPALPLSGLPTPPGLSPRGQETNDQDAPSRRQPVLPLAAPTPASDESTRITLSAASQTAGNEVASATTQAPGAIYAEIWKDGVRIAAVHTNGAVTPALGLSWPTVPGNDPGIAQRRAEELARTVGGEVRYANSERRDDVGPPVVDARTERMRARLRATYGV